MMPEGSELSFMLWWKSVGSSNTLQVRYPHHLHGLARMPSKSSKPSAKQDFLRFVDSNSQPNGRSADSASATHYLLPKFRTIQTPKKGVCNYEVRVTQSLVGEFNCVQNENKQQTISNYSGSVWLKRERPKHAIYPHKKTIVIPVPRSSWPFRASKCLSLKYVKQDHFLKGNKDSLSLKLQPYNWIWKPTDSML